MKRASGPSPTSSPASAKGWLTLMQKRPEPGQHPCRFGHCGRHVVDVHQRVVRHHQVEGLVRERQRGRVGQQVRRPRCCLCGEAGQRRRAVQPDDPVAPRCEVPRDAALTRTDFQGPTARRRDQIPEEQLAVVPVLVVARFAGPGAPSCAPPAPSRSPIGPAGQPELLQYLLLALQGDRLRVLAGRVGPCCLHRLGHRPDLQPRSNGTAPVHAVSCPPPFAGDPERDAHPLLDAFLDKEIGADPDHLDADTRDAAGVDEIGEVHRRTDEVEHAADAADRGIDEPSPGVADIDELHRVVG